MFKNWTMTKGLVAGIAGASALALAASGAWAGKYGFGTTPTPAEIAAIDIDAMPDGRGLPAGSGTVAAGEKVYNEKCAVCHGPNLEGVKGTGGAALIGGRGSIGTPKTKKTVESYWPYASTVFDFVKRAMPFQEPGSMNDNDIYAVTAYILYRGKIIDKGAVMNAKTLPAVKMPNRDGFIPDPRPDIFHYR